MIDYIDGFLEGHEGPAYKACYRIFMISFILWSLFSAIGNLAVITTNHGYFVFTALNSVAIFGMLGMVLKMAHWYRKDNMDPKFRKGTAFMIFCVMMLNVAACMVFHEIITYTPAAPVPSTPRPFPFPTPNPSPSPGGTPTPSTPNPPNNSMTGGDEWSAEVQAEEQAMQRPSEKPRRRRPRAERK